MLAKEFLTFLEITCNWQFSYFIFLFLNVKGLSVTRCAIVVSVTQ